MSKQPLHTSTPFVSLLNVILDEKIKQFVREEVERFKQHEHSLLYCFSLLDSGQKYLIKDGDFDVDDEYVRDFITVLSSEKELKQQKARDLSSTIYDATIELPPTEKQTSLNNSISRTIWRGNIFNLMSGLPDEPIYYNTVITLHDNDGSPIDEIIIQDYEREEDYELHLKSIRHKIRDERPTLSRGEVNDIMKTYKEQREEYMKTLITIEEALQTYAPDILENIKETENHEVRYGSREGVILSAPSTSEKLVLLTHTQYSHDDSYFDSGVEEYTKTRMSHFPNAIVPHKLLTILVEPDVMKEWIQHMRVVANGFIKTLCNLSQKYTEDNYAYTKMEYKFMYDEFVMNIIQGDVSNDVFMEQYKKMKEYHIDYVNAMGGDDKENIDRYAKSAIKMFVRGETLESPKDMMIYISAGKDIILSYLENKIKNNTKHLGYVVGMMCHIYNNMDEIYAFTNVLTIIEGEETIQEIHTL